MSASRSSRLFRPHYEAGSNSLLRNNPAGSWSPARTQLLLRPKTDKSSMLRYKSNLLGSLLRNLSIVGNGV